MTKLLLIASAGACGTLCRYWLSVAVYDLLGRNFPWGTWAVNILGCFLFGLLYILAEERELLSSQARMLMLVGFMGAFTTFATFVFESSVLFDGGHWMKLALNVAGQNIIGFAALYVGMSTGKIL